MPVGGKTPNKTPAEDEAKASKASQKAKGKTERSDEFDPLKAQKSKIQAKAEAKIRAEVRAEIEAEQAAKKAEQAAAQDPVLEGIEFADGPEPQINRPDEMDSLARAEANQQAAHQAIEKMRNRPEAPNPNVSAPYGDRPKAPTAEELEEINARRKHYMVLEDRRIRRGAADYVLVAGKIFSNNEYDVANLKRQGVKLKEIDPSEVQVQQSF